MTTFTLFKLLGKKEQANLLLKEGTHLNSRQEPEFLIDLYALEDLLVEIYYHQPDHEIVLVKSFHLPDKQSQQANLLQQMAVAWRNF